MILIRPLSLLLLLVLYSVGDLVRQEDVDIALVDWGHLWPHTNTEVTVTANGETELHEQYMQNIHTDCS